MVPRALPGRCNPLQPARAGALGAGGLGRSAAAWRDEGRAPGSGLYQERIPRRHLRVLGQPDAAIPCITSPLKWFPCGVGGSGRQPIQSADPGRGAAWGSLNSNLNEDVWGKGAGHPKEFRLVRKSGPTRARFGRDGRAIRCSPLVRQRLGTPGLGRPAGASRDADGPEASGCAKSVSRGLVCEFWDAQERPCRASQLRSNGFPSGSAAVGASPFRPPTPGGAWRVGRTVRAKYTECD